MIGLAITLLALATVVITGYFANQKYAEHQQKKQTMAFLGVDEESK